MMTNAEFISELAKKTGLKKDDAKKAFRSVFEMIGSILEKGDSFRVSEFGTFLVKERASRSGFNPQTGTKIQIPAKKAVAFRPSSILKEAVQ